MSPGEFNVSHSVTRGTYTVTGGEKSVGLVYMNPRVLCSINLTAQSMKRHVRGLYPWLLAFPAMTCSLELQPRHFRQSIEVLQATCEKQGRCRATCVSISNTGVRVLSSLIRLPCQMITVPILPSMPCVDPRDTGSCVGTIRAATAKPRLPTLRL